MADITAARLNNLQSRIALILGTGSGTNGYGQTVVSSQVNNSSDTVDAEGIVMDRNALLDKILNSKEDK